VATPIAMMPDTKSVQPYLPVIDCRAHTPRPQSSLNRQLLKGR
jgi:hypothetical protein